MPIPSSTLSRITPKTVSIIQQKIGTASNSSALNSVHQFTSTHRNSPKPTHPLPNSPPTQSTHSNELGYSPPNFNLTCLQLPLNLLNLTTSTTSPPQSPPLIHLYMVTKRRTTPLSNYSYTNSLLLPYHLITKTWSRKPLHDPTTEPPLVVAKLTSLQNPTSRFIWLGLKPIYQ